MQKFWIGARPLEIKNAYLVEIRGWMDLSTYSQVENFAQSLVKTGQEILIFDLNQLQYINSQGLGSWLALQKRLEEKGGSVILVGPRERVKQTIEITGVDKIIPTYENLEEAKKNPVFRTES